MRFLQNDYIKQRAGAKFHTSLIKATGGSGGICDEGIWDIMLVFLALNGYELSYSQKELSDVILALASGDIGEKEILQWIIEHQQ